MPLISIVVPVYNTEIYLKECIESILNQTFRDFELILVDDGSPDNSPKICEEYKRKDKRVIVIHKENGGVSSARNCGIEYALNINRSKFLTFIDSDDIVASNYLQVLIESSDKYDFVASNYVEFKNKIPTNQKYNFETTIVYNYREYWKLSSKCHDLLVIVCGKLFNTKLFEDIRFPVGLRYEDYYVMHKIAGKIKCALIIPAVLYYYRQHDASFMHSNDGKNIKTILNKLSLNINLADYYCSLEDKEFFNKYFDRSFNELINVSLDNKKIVKTEFHKLKILSKNKKKIFDQKRSKSEMLFFISPLIFELLKKQRNKQ